MIKLHSMLNFVIFLATIVMFLHLFTYIDNQTTRKSQILRPNIKYFIGTHNLQRDEYNQNQYNLWLIFTKVLDQSPLYFNFKRLINNIVTVSSIRVQLHIITDDASKEIANGVFQRIQRNGNETKISYKFYNVSEFAANIQDIVEAMTPQFSSRPGTYYSDALFYISLGLYRLAPKEQKLAVMVDCDVHFKQDLRNVFEEFKLFKPGQLFGLAPELSPVYKHILYAYKLKHNTTTFGEYFHSKEIFNNTNSNMSSLHPNGFPGYNSGVILFNFSAIRESSKYKAMITKEAVAEIATKYSFRGHLGDQDFYTLLGYEYPEMFRTLSCKFNRQLCTWWRDNGGYKDIFNNYFNCNEEVVILHGNCNTPISV